MGGLIAALSPANATKAADTDAQVQAGRELFVVSCSFCHGMNGEGVLTDNGQLGPSLVGVGWRAPFIHTGCAQTLRDRFDDDCGGRFHGSVEALDESQMNDLITFLESL